MKCISPNLYYKGTNNQNTINVNKLNAFFILFGNDQDFCLHSEKIRKNEMILLFVVKPTKLIRITIFKNIKRNNLNKYNNVVFL